MRLRGAWSMIDLEGVYPLERLDLVAAHHSAFAYRPYAAFVANHMQAPLPPVEPTRSFPETPGSTCNHSRIPQQTQGRFQPKSHRPLIPQECLK